MSLVESPLALNLLMRLARVEEGGGSTPLFAAERLADLESLLPTFTFQLGPPSYNNMLFTLFIYKKKHIFIYLFINTHKNAHTHAHVHIIRDNFR